jgi:hypothetical protein
MGGHGLYGTVDDYMAFIRQRARAEAVAAEPVNVAHPVKAI